MAAEVDGAGLGEEVSLPWKFSNAETLLRVEDGLASGYLLTLGVSVTTVSGGLLRREARQGRTRRGGAHYVPGACWDFLIRVMLRRAA